MMETNGALRPLDQTSDFAENFRGGSYQTAFNAKQT